MKEKTYRNRDGGIITRNQAVSEILEEHALALNLSVLLIRDLYENDDDDLVKMVENQLKFMES